MDFSFPNVSRPNQLAVRTENYKLVCSAQPIFIIELYNPQHITTMYQSDDSDRFIPNRSAMDIEVGHFNLMKENMGECSPSKQQYKEELANSLFQGSKVDELKILALKNKAPAPKEGFQNRLRVLYTQNSVDPQHVKKQAARYLPQTSERVLDAPDLLNDYYLNLLDWSSSNLLAVALGQSLYVWNATTSEITKLLEFDGVPITSVAWMNSGSHIGKCGR